MCVCVHMREGGGGRERERDGEGLDSHISLQTLVLPKGYTFNLLKHLFPAGNQK